MRACQKYFGGIHASRTLHVGDQFLSAGANDFKVGPFSNTVLPARILTMTWAGSTGEHDGLDRRSCGNGSIAR